MRDFCWSEITRLLPDAIINGPGFENRAPNNLNVSIPGLDAQMAVIALNTHGVSASTRSACDVGGDEPSHVIQALGIPRELAGTAIRFTFLPDVSKRQATAIAEALAKVAQLYRNAIVIPKNVV